MTEKSQELVVTLHMHDTAERWDSNVHGYFNASVHGHRDSTRYDQNPFEALYGGDHLYGRFAMTAYYGDMTMHDGGAWGFEAGYEPEYGLVRGCEAERFAKGLKKYTRAYDKLCEEYGSPQTLGQKVVYAMRALGVRRAYWRLPKGQEGSMYRDWRPLDSMEDIRRHIDGEIEQCRRRQHKQESAA